MQTLVLKAGEIIEIHKIILYIAEKSWYNKQRE